MLDDSQAHPKHHDEPQPAPQPPLAPAPQGEPNWVVRAGVVTPEQLKNGVGGHALMPGLHGFSVQSELGRTIFQLGEAGHFPNAQISVSTVEALVAAGQAMAYSVRVVKSPGRGFHCTVEVPEPLPDTLAEALSHEFTQLPNPARVRR
jgi:hypothetical protein